MNRREFVQRGALAAGGVLLAGAALGHIATGDAVLQGETGPYTLPPLPYAPEALAPHIDAETMRIHHGRHHQGYVDKLNAALATQHELKKDPLEVLFANLAALPTALQAPLRNQGGGHWNHSFFWPQLQVGTRPSAELQRRISAEFGSWAAFQETFGKAALGVFGSGWAWLVLTAEGKLALTATPNQDNPLMDVAPLRGQPILALDVWEHAYYLNYQNRRADYLTAFWNVVNWPEVERRLG